MPYQSSKYTFFECRTGVSVPRPNNRIRRGGCFARLDAKNVTRFVEETRSQKIVATPGVIKDFGGNKDSAPARTRYGLLVCRYSVLIRSYCKTLLRTIMEQAI